MTESKIMKTIPEMNQDEKTELLKTIEENRIDKIKTLKETLEDLTNKPKEFEPQGIIVNLVFMELNLKKVWVNINSDVVKLIVKNTNLINKKYIIGKRRLIK